MNFVFIVQGEGRGHMTQAIALSKILRKNDHTLSKVIVGTNPSQSIPNYFISKIETPIIQLESPNFVKDNKRKSINLSLTLFQTLWKSNIYRKNIKILSEIIAEEDPDVIINFYDFLAGIYNFWYRPKSKFICIAHQYLINHPEFTFPRGKIMNRIILKLANYITRLKAAKVLALSFQDFNENLTTNLIVTPPLLRDEVFELNIKTENYLLIYVVNPGYGEEIEHFHRKNPNIPLVCFWDNKQKPSEYVICKNLIFYQLNDQLFLEKMAACKGFVTTAGFDSVCEAMFLGKATLMIPVKGQYEQACNAIDASKAGAGITRSHFDLSALIDYFPKHKNIKNQFQPWVAKGENIFIQHLT
ncbi:MAG: glycosyltransferase [Flammeovirgaceae bacterium]|nr:glycosyltransferase [Flammeovirgaceae bacterium]